MQSIQEEQDLPRFHRDFIGISHQLEKRRKQRRRIQMEERSMANRVLFLEKEEVRAQKSLFKKREELGRVMAIAQRQALQKELKERALLERERQVQIAKEENHLRRILHKQNTERCSQMVASRKSIDYHIGKKQIKEGQMRKKQEQRQDLINRQERYFSLNAKKQQGRSRIDKFYKERNLDHTRLYKEKIQKEEGNTKQKIDTIKKLGEIEGVLRKRLEESSMRVSQMEQIIGDFTETFKNKSSSRLSLHQTLPINPHHDDDNSPTLITSVEGELLGKGEVQQKIQDTVQGGGVSEGGKVRRRRRNKHANRYKQYELF